MFSLRTVAAYAIVLILLAIPVFGHLDSLPLETFDETRVAVSATEMSQSGDLIRVTFAHQPELWSTKPPLLIWIQALFLTLFGYNEVSLRLPSAISAALCCLLLLRFLKRRTGSWLPGIIASAILITSKGFVGVHASRTCDYDAMLALCTLASLLWLVDFTESGKTRFLYYSGCALIAAVFTKGVAGLFFLPAMIAYILLQQKALLVVKNRAFWVMLGSFILLVGGYYFLREKYQPGYVAAVVRNELGGRYLSVIEKHVGDGWTYYDMLKDHMFTYWFLLIPLAIIDAAVSRDTGQRRIALLCVLAVSSLLIILSFAATKLEWYLVPIYPLLAILCGLLIWHICLLLAQYEPASGIWRYNLLPLFFLLIIGYEPYSFMLDQAMHSSRTGGDWDIKTYLKDALAGNRKLAATRLCGDIYPVLWYSEVARTKGIPLREVSKDSLNAGDTVLAWDPGIKEHIAKHYDREVLDTLHSLQVIIIKGVH